MKAVRFLLLVKSLEVGCSAPPSQSNFVPRILFDTAQSKHLVKYRLINQQTRVTK